MWISCLLLNPVCVYVYIVFCHLTIDSYFLVDKILLHFTIFLQRRSQKESWDDSCQYDSCQLIKYFLWFRSKKVCL